MSNPFNIGSQFSELISHPAKKPKSQTWALGTGQNPIIKPFYYVWKNSKTDEFISEKMKVPAYTKSRYHKSRIDQKKRKNACMDLLWSINRFINFPHTYFI